MSGLLDGVRVVDLSRVLAGPFAGQVLAEMGADVIKVEPPEGDMARGIGPHIDGRSLYFSSLNTNKRGVVLDLTTGPGRRDLEALLDAADIMVENYREPLAPRPPYTHVSIIRRQEMATSSTMTPLGTTAPDFALPEPLTGKTVTLADFAEQDALLAMFICNHCPYVQHLQHGLSDLGRDYEGSRLGIVAISSNDVTVHPTDGPDQIAVDAKELDFRFPYLYDEGQEVAKAYGAVCTPDFFLFDSDRALVYRGRFDATRPNMPGKVTGSDLRAAIEAVLAGDPVSADQFPSMGCSIKWKAGNAPAYAS